MKITNAHEFNDKQDKCVRKAAKLEYLTLAYLLSVTVLMYIVMGSSQAMKTAWVEDILSMLPPITFLIANYFRSKKPNTNFPYGFHRITTVGFLISSLALLCVGLFLIIDGGLKLIQLEHPTIGMKSFFGLDMWLGWWMIIVLIWGSLPPVALGIIKTKLAEPINDKIIHVDAEMNRADWITGVAAMLGVLAIGFGLWWGDALAAVFISTTIINDGWKQTKDSFTELLNRRPKDLKGKYLDLPEKLKHLIREESWIEEVEVRMREEGHIIFTEAFIRPVSGMVVTPRSIVDLQRSCQALDWRLHEVVISFLGDDV